MKHNLSQLGAASHGAESQRLTDWVYNGSVQNNIQSQKNFTDSDPRACAFVHLLPMTSSLLVNTEGVNISKANFGDLTGEPTLLFQQQSCAAGTSLSMTVVNSGLNDTSIAPPTFEIAQVNPGIFFENSVSNPVRAVPVHVFPSLQRVMTLTNVTPQRFTSPIATNSSIVTEIFPNLSSCKKPLTRVFKRLIATSHAFTVRNMADGKVAETSKPVVPGESRCIVFCCNPSAQTSPHSTRIMTNSL